MIALELLNTDDNNEYLGNWLRETFLNVSSVEDEAKLSEGKEIPTDDLTASKTDLS